MSTLGTAANFSDTPRDVRAEDAFDVAAMQHWLSRAVPQIGTENPLVQQFPGGASNLTYLLRYPDRDLILRRPPAGTKAASAHDMQREFRVQQQLAADFGLVPQVLALCTDPSVIGSDFYVMTRVPGLILRGDLPAGFTLDPATAKQLCASVVTCLVELHAVDPAAAGLADLGKGAGYVNRQVIGWSKRYRAAKTDNVPDFESVMAWLAAHQPDDVGICVVHGDYRLDNLVLDPDQLTVRALLDWEMATLGDPLMDLGCAMAYWVQADDDEGMQLARRQPSNAAGMMTRSEFVAAYCEQAGQSTQNWVFYEVFGIFRLAVIAQQIYYRYHHGETTNPAFANFHAWVSYADQRCQKLIAAAPR